MSITLKARSCRYMPPEKAYDWDEHKTMPYYMRGARSYFDIGLRNVDSAGASVKEEPAGMFRPIRSFLTRLGLLG